VPPDFEGCSRNYWNQSNHLDSWVATGYTPSQTLESVFNVPDKFKLDSVTLRKALSFDSGSSTTAAARTLLRYAVAAILNGAHPGVNFPRTDAEVIADVNAALVSDSRSTMLNLAADLRADDNLGCALD
jgi:hypothetical protein